MSTGVIKKVAGPLVIAEGMRDANMFDVVRVSKQRLIGEIIEMHGDEASIQVYEETSGLGPGEPVESMEVPMSVELGPGLITSIYDGIQRPLDDIMKISGNNLKRGVEVPSLKRDLKWEFVPVVKAGDEVEPGDVIGTVQETALVQQKIMLPYGIKGTIKEIRAGSFTVEEVVAIVAAKDGEKELTLMQRWPVRRGRPYKKKLPPKMPLVTGQRVIDTFFPIAKGGVAVIGIRAGAVFVPVFVEGGKRPFRRTRIIFGEAYRPTYTGRHGTAEEVQAIADEVLRRAYALGRETP